MKHENKMILISLISVVLTLLIVGGFFFYWSKHTAKPQPMEETYTVVANSTDGPEQIFEKAFAAYTSKHHISMTTDQSRQVAEYMAANNLNGKAYWVDKNGQRHELWIGTGDKIVLSSDSATFVISNAYSDNQKKTITVKFGFKEAADRLQALKIMPTS